MRDYRKKVAQNSARLEEQRAKDRARRKRNYVPFSQLPAAQGEEMRRRVRESTRRCRMRKKQQQHHQPKQEVEDTTYEQQQQLVAEQQQLQQLYAAQQQQPAHEHHSEQQQQQQEAKGTLFDEINQIKEELGCEIYINKTDSGNTERQRRWREKQRKDNYDQYLSKERQRKRSSYTPTHLLSPEKQEERRKRCREDARKHYIRKKKKAATATIQESTESQENTSSQETYFDSEASFQSQLDESTA